IIYSTSTTVCGFTSDTFRLVVPTATIDAGTDDTAYGCGIYRDTLLGSVGGLEPGVLYTYTWTPANTIVSGGNTVVPVVAPTGPTTYTLTVTTNSNQGGCSWTDSVNITTVDVNVVPGFTFSILYGCEQDTVVFTNTSQFTSSYFWDFGDGTTDTAANPTHIYTAQGNYIVKQVVSNGVCIDSLIATVNLVHPLSASFTTDLDTICQGQSVTFTNTSTTTTINNIAPTFTWTFGDGSSSSQFGVVHQYLHPGVYTVTLLVQDFVPCVDSVTRVIVVDSQSTVELFASDSIICAGQKVDFDATFLTGGMNTYVWDMGNGIVLTDEGPLGHTYEYPGTYHVTLNVDYNMCADVSDDMYITVRPYPAINLGADTSFCPNAGNYVLSDLYNLGNPAASWIWNTGATTGSISIDAPGTYYGQVTVDGCSNTDSVEVLKNCYLDIPNVFSPDGDHTNDYFLPRQMLSKGVVSFKMSIYNRWGQQVFETTNIDGRGWDGNFNTTPQPQGVYVYLIEVAYKDGRAEKYQGNVTLLR
ncbi:MAG: PKD domain-containing protein, partial [Flavipsychrobacter sp.]|nr:PKD domain-containing protein [Flavipsychrobacter sp.]